MQLSPLTFTNLPNGQKLAYHASNLDKQGVGVLFCGGFRSDMTGTKAQALEEYCVQHAIPFVRFDYRGHGQSDGKFEDHVLSDWLADIEHIKQAVFGGRKLVLIGSSMGGWLGLQAAIRKPEECHAFIGIAAAPDFTRNMIGEMDPLQHEALKTKGYIEIENDYGAPYLITSALLEDGEKLCLLDKQNRLKCPITLLQGKQDTSVHWHTPFAIAQAISTPALTTHLLEQADHSLSAPSDLTLLCEILESYLRL